jgi:tetracycline 7-halogenase / FADH2 O2-dependent halogenase
MERDMSRTDHGKQFDVTIIGSGLGGSTLAAALARNGVRVLLLDGGTHPRFAVGEATIPYTNVTQRLIADRYGIPELKNLCTLADSTRAIGPKFGTKTHFGFLRHEEGKPQDPREVNQFHTPPALLAEAHHLYRQDSDSYVFHLALQYGARARQNFRIAGVDVDGSGVTIHGENGDQYRSRYVVDAGGFRSPLAEAFNLREQPTRFKHQSRSMFTHMIGLPHTDELWSRPSADRPPVPWNQGTVHHTFERGWFWYIAFNNTKLSKNPLASVGLTLDPRLYPRDPSLTPMEDFMSIASRFPDIERQYAGGVPVREWVSTDRVQYSSKQLVGDRWCLLAHAAGFLDPLFSFGLAVTGDAVNALAWRLIRAVKDDDFSAGRFEYMDRMQQARLDYVDEVVNAAYTAFSDFDLWKAVFRCWVWPNNAGTFRLQAALSKFRKDGDDEHFRALEEPPYLGMDWPVHEGMKQLYDLMVSRCDAVQAGRMSTREAADDLWGVLSTANFMTQPFGFGDRERRFMHPTPMVVAKSALWARRNADPMVRQMLLGVGKEAVGSRLRGSRIF